MTKAKVWPPLMSADGKEIRVGDLLYRPDVYISTFTDERHRFQIEVLRVTSVDLSRRVFLARCSKGCERDVNYRQSCDSAGYYVSKDKALAAAVKAKMDGVAEIQAEVEGKKNLLTSAKDLRAVWQPEPVQ